MDMNKSELNKTEIAIDMDELRAKWAEHDQKIEASLRLNQQIISEVRLNRAKSALLRLTLSLALESVMMFAVIAALGAFIYQHFSFDQTRFALPAITLDLYAIAIFIALIRQITAARQIDYGKPVAAIQKEIEALRILRIRYLQGIFLGAPLVWTPLLIVMLKGFFGLDVYRVISGAWLAANLLFGLAFIPLAIWMSKKFGSRMGRFPIIQRLINDLMGHSLNDAAGFLAALSEFEAEK